MKISDKAKTDLLELITVKKKYKPGDKLPNENELSAELGISRTTLREAIQYLRTQGVLEIRRGKGTFVAEESIADEEFGFDELNVMHIKIKDLYELRMMLEPDMAYYATLRASDEEINEILQIGERLEEVSTENAEDPVLNERFHIAIARASHNEFGIKLMEIINKALVKAFRDSSMKQTLYNDVMDDHKMIMNYLKLRDCDGVREAMRLHMKHSMSDYVK
ncbi:FadR/GntR family transcriptional regulator [Agathobacter sp.]